MMGNAGKGDRPRKRQVSYETYAKNWDRIFGKKTTPDYRAVNKRTPKK